MRCITFQPKYVLDQLLKGKDYTPECNYTEVYNILGKNCIFANKFESTRQVLLDIFASCNSFPQSMIIFDTDEYKYINKIGWNRYIINKDDREIYSSGAQEIITYKIRADKLVYGKKITQTDNVDIVQDKAIKFMENNLYKIINPFISTDKREDISLVTNSVPGYMQYRFLELISKLNFEPENFTENDMQNLYDSILSKMIIEK